MPIPTQLQANCNKGSTQNPKLFVRADALDHLEVAIQAAKRMAHTPTFQRSEFLRRLTFHHDTGSLISTSAA
jgi:hypothetical protein